MKRVLLRTPAFIRAARRLLKKQPAVAEAVQSTLTLLESDAFDARLRSHKLSGELAGAWACSAGYDLRIVFEFVRHDNAEAILLHSVGTHDEVY